MKHILTLLTCLVLLASCSNSDQKEVLNSEIEVLKTELDSVKSLYQSSKNQPKEQIATFLTFQENNAEAAMNFYIETFENSKVIDIKRYGKEGPAKEGSIMMARFELNGSQFVCSDSYIKHEWSFTPGVSNFVDCKSEDEIDSLFSKLSENGKVLMPLGNYGWSSKFAFIEDQFGVSWQLNLD